METECKSGIFLLLCSIFVSIFVHADQKHGFLKNIAGQVPDKWMLVVSKMIGTGVQNLVMFGVIFITMGAAGKIYFGDGFVIGSGIDILKVLGSQYLLHMGFSGLILCMCILFRSSALSMTAGIMISCRVTALIYLGINRLAELYFQADGFDISKYAIEFNVITFSVDAQRDDIVRAMMVAAGVLVVSVFISGVVTQNRDIR